MGGSCSVDCASSSFVGPALPCVRHTVYVISPKVPGLVIPVPKQDGRRLSLAVPGPAEGESEGRGIFKDRHGGYHTTPSRPLPISIRGPRVLCKDLTKLWWHKYDKPPAAFKDSGSRFGGQRKSKRASWGEWIPPASRGTKRKPDGSEGAKCSPRSSAGKTGKGGGGDSSFGLSLPSIMGDEGMSAASSPSPPPRAPPAQPRIGKHRGSSGCGFPSVANRVAKLSRPPTGSVIPAVVMI